jgi:crossover junction endodeoxyribonuclease RuvC
LTRILGIDPGSRVTGFGVIDSDGQKSTHVAHGCLDIESGTLADRLRLIFEGVGRVVRLYRPDEMAVELVFMYRNPDSALKLGQARGVAVVAGALADLPVFEFTPAEVKLAIVGLGRADKAQVQHMVKVLLRLDAAPPSDAADALAVALCHGHTRSAALPYRRMRPQRWA